jgi:hypothetical protein
VVPQRKKCKAFNLSTTFETVSASEWTDASKSEIGRQYGLMELWSLFLTQDETYSVNGHQILK